MIQLLHIVLIVYSDFFVHAQNVPLGIGQANDWLLQETCNTTTTVTMNNNVLTVSNGLISRSFLTSPALCTIEYQRLTPIPFTYLRALSPEGNLTLNNTPFNLGGCLGVPVGHAEFWNPEGYLNSLKPDPEAFSFASFTVSEIDPPFAYVPGTRGSPMNIPWPPKGVHLTLHLTPPQSDRYAPFAGVLPSIHYEVYDCVPAFRKWIEVDNGNPQPVLVDAITVELLRAPNGAPEMITTMNDVFAAPPFDDQIVPDVDSHFPSRSGQLWFWDPDFDQGDDQELHATWTYYTYLRVGYSFDIVFGGPTGPAAIVAPKTTFQGLSWRFILHDSPDLDRRGITIKRFLRLVAPQTYEVPTQMMTTNINSTDQFRLAVSQAAAVGIEIMIVGFGADGYCGLCDAQMLNETWRTWFAEQVHFAKTQNVTMSAYTLMQHNAWGEEVPVEEQALDREGNPLGVACMATDWHARYRANVLEFIKNVSLGGLETDGEYESYPCSSTKGDHRHNGINGSFHAQLMTTLEFNQNLKQLGVFQTSADSLVFSGVNRWGFADTDAGSSNHLPLWEFLTLARNYVYDSTFYRTPASGFYGIADMSQLTFDNCGGAGVARMQCLNFALGSFLVSGFFPMVVADTIYPKGDPDAAAITKIFGQWYGFYKKYSAYLSSDLFLHAAPITSRTLEVTLHSRRNCQPGEGCLLVGLVNPTSFPISQLVPISVYYSGIKSGSTVTIVDITPPRPVEEQARPDAIDLVVGAKAGTFEILLPVTVAGRDFQSLQLSLK